MGIVRNSDTSFEYFCLVFLINSNHECLIFSNTIHQRKIYKIIYRNMSEPYYIINISDVYGEYDYMGIERC